MHTLTLPRPYSLTDSDIVIGEGETRYMLRVRDLPIEEKPREKLLRIGPHNLTHAELMAILLGVGTRREEVMAMSHRILREYGHRAIINERNPKRLAESLQIPIAKACQIIASFELGRRAYQQKAGKPTHVRTARQAYDHLKSMGDLQKEQLRGLYLNSRYQVIHEEVISVGSVTANIVHPREVFQPALQYSAVAVIVAHNHPSGVPEPTEDDLRATDQLIAAGKVLGIDLLDHLIIVKDSYISLTERNDND
ncbi:MAG: DNA repair protein RadC [Candidatus Saccharibacteria bacterium]|jgi:DNA repair protein RadC|nr:MAG: DNA repair protein RadC [Candidatus Saccharibacteria bacterium]